jgi:uncharacterized membrane protein YdjX (TVP38/TMEM64 family)/rhodanese-related sulfurtransferase
MTMQNVIPRLALPLVVAAMALWLAFNRDRVDPTVLQATIRDLGILAPVVHVVLFAVGTVLFVPGALFGLVGGVLFGPAWGTLLNLVGATLGATAAFLLARYVAQDRIRQRAGGKLDRLVSGVETEGWRFVAFVRLVPLFPFSLLNYALGLTRIPLAPYIAASLVCMLPGTFAYTWLGYAGREALAENDAALRYGLIGLALLAAIAFLPRLVRRLRTDEKPRWIDVDELAARLGESNGTTVIDVRRPDEFAGPLGHIRNARNVPLGDLPARLGDLRLLAEKLIIVVCHTDKRSANAAGLLAEAGFGDVRVLRGGMVRWNEARLPVEDRRFGSFYEPAETTALVMKRSSK